MGEKKRLHISQLLAHSTIERAGPAIVGALAVIDSGVQDLTATSAHAGFPMDPFEKVCFVRGVAHAMGFILTMAKHKLREEEPVSCLGETPFPDTSAARLAEAAVTIFQASLGMYQATRYITAVAATDDDNDMTPDLIIAKDDVTIENFYKALKRMIPEFSMPPDGSGTIH